MSNPAGFFSYVRFNDDSEEGRLSELRDKLEKEVAMLLGEKFELFQDSKGVGMGENWQKRLDEGLAESTLFIPILTPAYLKRQACRDELEKFLAKEKGLGRDDLVLPLIYVETLAVTDEARRTQDPLAVALHAHQYRDWSDLRFEPWDKSKFMRLNAIAKEIVKALERGLLPTAAPSRKPKTKAVQKARATNAGTKSDFDLEGISQSQAVNTAPETQEALKKNKRVEPTTFVVDPMPGRGDFTSIGAAIAAASGGERILVHPHIYSEAVKLDKSVELIGDGKREDIVIEASGADAILFQASFGRVANLTLRQTGGGNWFCVDIPQGQLVLEDCDITSQSLACVAIHGGANPILRRNAIHDGHEAGIIFFENGKGTLEDNDIFSNKFSGVQISTGADPVLRRNRLRDGKQGGVLAFESGKGTLEDNDIFGNALAGVQIRTKADSVVRRNRIRDGKQGGVFVEDGGKGTFEDNDIFGNALSGVEIKTLADPVLRRNRIHDGKEDGVLVHTDGKGTLEDNDIFGNILNGVEVRERGAPTLHRNRIYKNEKEAIWINDGSGIFRDNDLSGNTKGAWRITSPAPDIVRENNIET